LCAGDKLMNDQIELYSYLQGTLFEEIAEGLKHAKVIIVCASDEVFTTVLFFLTILSQLQFKYCFAIDSYTS